MKFFILIFQLSEPFSRRSRLVSDLQRKVYRNLLSLSVKLFRFKTRSFQFRTATLKKKYRELEKEIHMADKVANKTWLNTKLAEIGRDLNLSD